MAKYKAKTKDCQLIVKAKIALGEKINERELDFFSSKYIRGLLKVKLIRKNMIEYSGPIGISLYDRLKKPISKYEFFFMMEQVVDLVQKLKANGLMINKVIFDIRKVYVNETTREMQFIYHPVDQTLLEVNVIEFMEKIIYSTNPMQEADTEYISRFVYFIKGLQEFDADKIEKYIVSEDRNVVNTIKKHNTHYDKNDEATGLLEDEATGLLNDEATGLLNDEATGLLNDEATGLLNEDVAQIHYATLYRVLTDETIAINKVVFRLGKERSYSDYFVGNNDKVSRSHADIITRGQKFYIIDLNSKNKTFVNGQAIPVQQEIEIFDGDKLKLANEEFELHF